MSDQEAYCVPRRIQGLGQGGSEKRPPEGGSIILGGESGGMLPRKILKFRSWEMELSVFWGETVSCLIQLRNHLSFC